MKNLLALSICLSVCLGNLNAQTKHWIKFANKNGTPYSIGTPTAFLTPKSVLRRTTHGIAVNQSDLPVTPAYIASVAAVSGVTVVYASKWLNGLVVSVTNTAVLNTISGFSFVTSTTPVGLYKLNMPDVLKGSPVTSHNKSSEVAVPNYYGRSYWQNKQLGLDCIHPQGFRGQGITIAVLDAGFFSVDVNPSFDSLRTRGGILGTRDFVSGGTSVYEDHNHGAAVLSLMAALVPSVIVGSAPRADYWLLRTEDVNTEKIIEEYNWIRGAEFADSVGVDILTTSLGYTTFDIPSQNHTLANLDGKTAPMSIAATMAARKGMFVLNAAGNEGGGGWGKIGVPADADSICTVGAIDSLINVANFSSRGPTADGRIKPDLCARGVQSWVSWQANGSCEAGNGTSYATPILAGAIACFWQAHPNFNNMTILDTLKATASHKPWGPNNDVGWGVPVMCCIPASIPESKNLPALKVTLTPNPFHSAFKINLPDYNYTSIQISVVNSLGALIKTLSPNLNERSIDCELNGISAGIYFVKISSSHGNSSTKVIKQ